MVRQILKTINANNLIVPDKKEIFYKPKDLYLRPVN